MKLGLLLSRFRWELSRFNWARRVTFGSFSACFGLRKRMDGNWDYA